jgi:hypothetical protein
MYSDELMTLLSANPALELAGRTNEVSALSLSVSMILTQRVDNSP